MRARTIDGSGLVPGVNVDPVDFDAGLKMAASLGYDDAAAQMIVMYALQRWARGEEGGAEQTWRSYFNRDYTSWRAILAAAVSTGAAELEAKKAQEVAER